MYHITFIESGFMATGKNYQAASEIGALIQFREEFPQAKFIYLTLKEI